MVYTNTLRRVVTKLPLAFASALSVACAEPRTEVRVTEPIVSPDWLLERGAGGVRVLHADFGGDRFDSLHIAGARLLDLDSLVWDGEQGWGTEMRPAHAVEGVLELAGVNDGDHLVLYSHNPLFASRAFLTLEAMGYDGAVSVLDGGLGGWQELGHPVLTSGVESGSTPRGEVSLAPRSDIMVSADWIAERLGNEGLALVDARPDDEYTGNDGGMGGMANPGHIPGAHQMYWEELIESRPLPWMHSKDSLEALFQAASAPAGDTVVVYCMVGWRASYSYLAARSLGREVRFYDGSWHDWGTRDDLPFVGGEAPGEGPGEVPGVPNEAPAPSAGDSQGTVR